jgi:hypothetical protein
VFIGISSQADLWDFCVLEGESLLELRMLLIDYLLELALPMPIFDLAEEDESAVGLDVELDPLQMEALVDCRLHLGHSALFGEIKLDQCAAFFVHDEVSFGAALDGDSNKVIDGHSARPGSLSSY